MSQYKYNCPKLDAAGYHYYHEPINDRTHVRICMGCSFDDCILKGDTPGFGKGFIITTVDYKKTKRERSLIS